MREPGGLRASKKEKMESCIFEWQLRLGVRLGFRMGCGNNDILVFSNGSCRQNLRVVRCKESGILSCAMPIMCDRRPCTLAYIAERCARSLRFVL